MQKIPINIGKWGEDEKKAYLGTFDPKIGFTGTGAAPKGYRPSKPTKLSSEVRAKMDAPGEKYKPKPGEGQKTGGWEHVMTSASPEVPKKKETGIKPGTVISMESVFGKKKEGDTEKSQQQFVDDSLENLKKTAEKHFGERWGKEDPKGSLDRIKKFKTKGGKVKSSPKSKKEREEMASEMIAHHMHHLGKHPGGREQAIAIGLSQAGESRDQKKGVITPTPLPEIKSLDKSVGSVENKKFIEKSIFDSLLNKAHKSVEDNQVSKALKASSVPRLPRAYLAQPKDIFRSATDIITRKDSRLFKDIQTLHTGPLSNDVIDQMKKDEEERTHRHIYKGQEYDHCLTCGRTFSKSFSDCPTCSISKSSMCKACGKHLTKTIGGSLKCSYCG